MESRFVEFVDSLRQPEYTGENRCLPCTVVNVAIGAVLALAAGRRDRRLGTAVAVGSAACIYLRGYLVPGTPELTKRYLPRRVLRWFGKDPLPTVDVDPDRGFDDPATLERTLLAVGALEETADGSDLRLTDAFAERWRGAMADVDREAVRGRLAAALDCDPEQFGARQDGVVLRADHRVVAQWPSEAALVADAAAADLLAERIDGWGDLATVQRTVFLSGLRLFAEDCPDGGGVETDSDVVESCCSQVDVFVVRCADSGERLLEQPVE
ncbi:hypothetical protein ACFPYI_21370 [Halomarina salina]|uniref:Uncharacterized protein n=1 Tax=Halomarina salina TaxID=1872699 RepID=A0ABD5RTV6_9EURY|nr:hypothetical protein [Halomarina salina]